MEYLIISIISIPFLYFNFKIIQKDIKEKIIPNKYLLYLIYLLPLLFIYWLFYYKIDINYLMLFYQFFFSILVSFLLYYFWIWWAWDAKYLLVLSLFILNIWIIPFIWNISLLLIIYLFFYFLYFYFWKCLLNFSYAKSLYKNIYTDIYDRFITFIKHSDWNIYKKTTFRIILNWTLIFLFVFISFRLTRLFIMSDIVKNKDSINYIWDYIVKYHIYFTLLIFLFFYIIRKFIVKIFQKIKNLLEKVFWYKHDKTKIFFPMILFSLLLLFILYEYILNPYEIWKYLYKIFTFYIFLFLIIRILIYSYKQAFVIAETDIINLNELKKWEIIDKMYLINFFWTQECLWLNNKDWIFYPNPAKYFQSISNPVDQETIDSLINIYNIVDDYHIKNKTVNYTKNDKIKILKTFAFAPYILAWFITTIFFQDKIFKIISETFIDFIQNNIYN